MHWLRMIFVVTVASLTALPDHAIAESLRERLVGTWLLVSNTNTGPDGTNRQPFGESPTGILILEANGRYAQVFTRPGRPKGAVNVAMPVLRLIEPCPTFTFRFPGVPLQPN
jgi:hypothetical protein